MTSTTFTPTTPTGFLTATRALAGRGVRKFWRTPQLVVIGTIQGAMFLLIFRYVFGGAITIPGVDYVDFLVPGFVATAGLFAAMTTAIGVAEDVGEGFVDRVASLPIPRLSILAGRAGADTVALVWNLAVTTALGFLVGFAYHGTTLEALAAFGLAVLLGIACTWLFVLVGLTAKNVQAAQGMTMLVFPLTFVSSAYVPVASMPAPLRWFAEHQPVTAVVDAVRALTLGDQAQAVMHHTAGAYVAAALAWCVGLTLVAAIASVLRFRRVTQG